MDLKAREPVYGIYRKIAIGKLGFILGQLD